jgi:hypothetical protein
MLNVLFLFRKLICLQFQRRLRLRFNGNISVGKLIRKSAKLFDRQRNNRHFLNIFQSNPPPPHSSYQHASVSHSLPKFSLFVFPFQKCHS